MKSKNNLIVTFDTHQREVIMGLMDERFVHETMYHFIVGASEPYRCIVGASEPYRSVVGASIPYRFCRCI